MTASAHAVCRERSFLCMTGSPIPIEFVGTVVLLGSFCTPWPLPAWPARRRVLWRLLQCFGCIAGPPICGGIGFVHTVITDILTSTCLLLWQFE